MKSKAHIALGRLLSNMRSNSKKSVSHDLSEEEMLKMLYPDVDIEAILCSFHKRISN